MVLGPDLFDGSAAQVTQFKNQIGGTFTFLLNGAIGTGNENMFTAYGDRDNYAVISKGSNLDVLAEEPATYMKRIHVSDSELEKQCIPLDRDLWHVGQYDDFLRERCRLLTASTNAFLGRN